VLSSENLDRESIHISLLANVLAPFRTTVVVVYRPFFEWVPSIHREIAYQRNVGSLSRWLTPHLATGIGTWKFPLQGGGQGFAFTDGVMRRYARYFENIRVLELKETFLNTFVCSFLSASKTCASLSKEPEKRLNVRSPESPQVGADACASQGGCLDRDVRTVLLDRTISTAKEVALLSNTALNANKTELAQKLDVLGLCFC